ncbi:hypothetical protein V6N11_037726 [Hibiscus sabdariffa]|uniref:Uncharacterized protein n=1 Tax=Hibiscus sabdariffa TaxID=183260 RepID=A0ABR2PC50_9ROSI
MPKMLCKLGFKKREALRGEKGPWSRGERRRRSPFLQQEACYRFVSSFRFETSFRPVIWADILKLKNGGREKHVFFVFKRLNAKRRRLARLTPQEKVTGGERIM